MKALIIEDTLTSLTVVTHQLEKMGIAPIQARSGEEGLLLFEEHRPDIVLLDIMMPGMDGYEVARRIRSIERSGEWTPIIFLTGLTGDADLEKGIAAGGDDYLTKPVSEVVLSAKVRAMQRIVQMRYSLLVLTRKLDTANQELQRLSSIDGLTSIANRRQFDEVLGKEWRRAIRSQKPLALLMLDVDAFKQYNDHYGHQGGDDCLKMIASVLRDQLKRPSDFAARFGGEEFAVLLPETSVEGAKLVAESLCESVRACKMPHEASSVMPYVTVSVGVASCLPDSASGNGTDLIAAADKALYTAKSEGRNRVSIAEDLSSHSA